MAEVPVVPTVPTVPVIGQTAQQPAAQERQRNLQKIADTAKQDIFRRVYYKTIQQGSLATFNYLYWKHDPYPLLLCSGIWGDGKVAGVNLHYLTFRYIKYLIQQYCGKAFSFRLIKNNVFIANAFRCYKKDGIRTAKVLDCEFLIKVLGSIRSFNPNEIEAIRQEVQRQLRNKMNPSTEDLTEEYTRTVAGNQGTTDKYVDFSFPRPTLDDARRNPTGLESIE